jgi:hypothetical protein
MNKVCSNQLEVRISWVHGELLLIYNNIHRVKTYLTMSVEAMQLPLVTFAKKLIKNKRVDNATTTSVPKGKCE